MCLELYWWLTELERILILYVAPRWVRHCYLSKTISIPYTCGLSRPFSGAVAGDIYTQAKTYQVPITNSYPSHYIICHLPLVFLSPTSSLSFYSPFFPFAFSHLPLVYLFLVRFIAIMSETREIIIDLTKSPYYLVFSLELNA